MTQRYVSLPAVGRRIPLGVYVAGWKLAKTHPERTFRHGLNHGNPTTGARALHEFREGMHDRINTRGGIDSAYRPRLFAHRWDMQAYLPPDISLLSAIAKHRDFTPERAADYLIDELGYETTRKAVDVALERVWLARRNGALVLTRKGKRALSKRIRAICRVH